MNRQINQIKQHQQEENSIQMNKIIELKKSNYFLFYWYLKLNPYATIVINTSVKHKQSDDPFTNNYPCDCIFNKEDCIYEMGCSYQFEYDEKLGINTIIFDEQTNIPIKDITIPFNKLFEIKRRILLQHILFHEVNRLLNQCHCQFELKSKQQSKDKILEKIEIEKMIHFRNNSIDCLSGNEFKRYYDFVSECIANYLDEYLNKSKKKYNIVVLGNDIVNTLVQHENNFIQIYSFEFLQSIDNLITKNFFLILNEIPFSH